MPAFQTSSKLRLALVVALAVGGTACTQKDTTPPPAPRIDPVTSPTEIPTQALTGTAEYGSKITVVRSPAFSSAEESTYGPFTTTADPFTAHFRMVVPLSVGADNTFTVTATDAAGNTSDATKVKITADPPAPDDLSLTLDHPIVNADDGTLSAMVQATNMEPGVDLSGFDITFSIAFSSGGPAGGVADVTATTDKHGRAVGNFTGLITTGAGTVTATAGTGTATASADFKIVHGATAVVNLALTPSPATVTPGTVVDYTVTAQDQNGNDTSDVIRMQTDAPAAVIAGGQISNLTTTGSYQVWATATSTGISDAEPLVVTTGTAANINLQLGATAVRTGQPLTYTLVVTDAYGNVVSDPTTVTTSDPTANVDTTNEIITFGTAGLQTVTATSGTLTDTEQVLVELTPDIVPPTVTITSPADGTAFAPGTDITVTIDATDDRSLTLVQLQGRGRLNYDNSQLIPTSPTPTTSTTVTFVVPTGGNRSYGVGTLTAAATDAAGNITVGATVSVTIDPAAAVSVTGGTATFVAGGNGSGINQPEGITTDDLGHLWVASNNNNSIRMIDLTNGNAVSQFGPDLGNGPHGVQYDPATHGIFVSMGGRIAYIDSNQVITDPWGFALGGFGGFDPRGLAMMTPTTGASTLYAASRQNGRVFGFDPTGAPAGAPVTSTSTTSIAGNLNQPWGVAAFSFSPTSAAIYVTDEANDSVWVEHFDPSTGAVTADTRLLQGGLINRPEGIVVLTNGDLLVASRNSGTLVRINTSTCDAPPAAPPLANCQGTVVASGFNRPYGIVRANDGSRVWVADQGSNAVIEVTGTF